MIQPSWSQAILNLARAINELTEARERFRVASMPVQKAQCEILASRLLEDMETMTKPEAPSPPTEAKVGT